MSQSQISISLGDVLVVDDAPANLRVLSTMLTNRGFKVRKALTGSNAIASARAIPPDIILLDIRLSELNGYEICQILKSDPTTSQIPIIFISALNDVSDKLKAFESGGIDYITKPFHEAEVLARVETQLRLQKLQRQLIQRNSELRRSNRELEQFAYAVSHDLQQPLQSMVGFAKLLLMKHQADLDRTSYEYLQNIVQSGDRAYQLIQNLLSYAQVEQQNSGFGLVDCNQLLKQVLDNLQAAISEKNANITVATLPTVIANESQLSQLFQNLLTNAIKFVPPERSPLVHVMASKQNHEWLFEIHDNGIGIGSQNFESIFGMFQRLHTEAEYPGTGIGLAICQKVVELHNGRIWVESQPDAGSTFYFTLSAALDMDFSERGVANPNLGQG
ncbi:MAG TPA: response regulator [Leptolyngbyaceae cyanobacterium M33_DOE_097]|uniref:histidine kinase n=1 Tax=Oscillatoriales cyanobacterium SpSt-418 TaxID=2282169 RepID=A0A7C3KAD5_9CYAN|nr:response regulator [Leptolyngbyaceae cyanobacterium M33_DOE_097]